MFVILIALAFGQTSQERYDAAKRAYNKSEDERATQTLRDESKKARVEKRKPDAKLVERMKKRAADAKANRLEMTIDLAHPSVGEFGKIDDTSGNDAPARSARAAVQGSRRAAEDIARWQNQSRAPQVKQAKVLTIIDDSNALVAWGKSAFILSGRSTAGWNPDSMQAIPGIFEATELRKHGDRSYIVLRDFKPELAEQPKRKR